MRGLSGCPGLRPSLLFQIISCSSFPEEGFGLGVVVALGNEDNCAAPGSSFEAHIFSL